MMKIIKILVIISIYISICAMAVTGQAKADIVSVSIITSFFVFFVLGYYYSFKRKTGRLQKNRRLESKKTERS